MARASKPKKRSSKSLQSIHKPCGVISPRVQKVRPERFGIVSVDCAKARSKWMLTDFFGRVLVPPTEVEHTRPCFTSMIKSLCAALEQAGIRDQIVVIERTGRYHRPIQRAFTKEGFEVRIIHPLSTKQHRQPANPGNKTDDTDLAAIHRGGVNGFGLLEPPPDPVSVCLQLLARHRRDQVEKAVALRCQIHEHLHAIMPGYSRCFDDIYHSQIPLWVARHISSAPAILHAGLSGLIEKLRRAGVRIHLPTLEKIVAWARSAPGAEDESSIHLRILIELDDDRRSKVRCVRPIEVELAALLVQTPYVLLLGIPGINVVSAAEFAGEMGPIDRYPTCRAITGRAGLFPSRYQSDGVDYPNGKLVRCANHSLRRAIMMIADNLVKCNDHFRVLATGWKLKGRDPRAIRVQVAGRFSRIAYQMVAARKAYRHPCCQQRDYVLKKLIDFHAQHETGSDQLMRDLDAAVAQLPHSEHREEAVPLAEELDRVLNKRGKGPRPLSEILPVVLAKLGVKPVRSLESGEAIVTEPSD
jgi:transposase